MVPFGVHHPLMSDLAPSRPPRLALVGDRSPSVQAHARIPELMDALSAAADQPIELYWLHSSTISGPDDVSGFDGIWVVPGSPYANSEGVIAAIEAARTCRIPFLGTCGGFQHMLMELARHVCDLPDATSAEIDPAAADPLIAPLTCSLLGEEQTVMIVPGSRAAEIMGAGPSAERFFCRYGLSPSYLDRLEAGGLVVSGRDQQNAVRVAELPTHPFFLGSLFQPELSSDATWVHPLIAAFSIAVRAHAAGAGAAPAVREALV
jgi:CTP synthase (UTP-ammonia lyase)